jgi:hypothetical protein
MFSTTLKLQAALNLKLQAALNLIISSHKLTASQAISGTLFGTHKKSVPPLAHTLAHQ